MYLNKNESEHTKELHQRLYKVYNNMISRCYNKNHTSYKNYGDKNITVCDDWRESFDNFLEDVDKIDGWDLNKFLEGSIQLDKDKKQVGSSSKVYSRDTCTFLTKEENRELQDDVISFYVVHPSGTIEHRKSLKPYCKGLGLNPAHAGEMLRGSKKRKSVKGYQFFNHYPEDGEILKRKTYLGISPEGEEVEFYAYNGLEHMGVTSSEVRNRINKRTNSLTKHGWLIKLKQDGYSLA